MDFHSCPHPAQSSPIAPLTGFPDALTAGQGSPVQPLIPLPEEPVEDTAAPAEHGALHLVDAGAPVLGLGWGGGGRWLRRVPLRFPQGGEGGPEGQGHVPTLQKVILQ